MQLHQTEGRAEKAPKVMVDLEKLNNASPVTTLGATVVRLVTSRSESRRGSNRSVRLSCSWWFGFAVQFLLVGSAKEGATEADVSTEVTEKSVNALRVGTGIRNTLLSE
eukprot:5921077-Amphidinium_carterae.2